MAKQKLIKCEVRYSNKDKAWVFVGYNPVVRSERLTKRAFIQMVVGVLQRAVANGAYGFSVRICRKDNSYQDELTIPKSRDPRKSKG